MQQNLAEDAITNLSRLSQKSGVRSTLVLARDTGAIVQSTGLESRDPLVNPESALPQGNLQDGATSQAGDQRSKAVYAEDVAGLVYDYVKTTSEMVQRLNGTADDEMKLLRLRTKKNELVIVPDHKYIAVVIHDTAPA